MLYISYHNILYHISPSPNIDVAPLQGCLWGAWVKARNKKCVLQTTKCERDGTPAMLKEGLKGREGVEKSSVNGEKRF